LTKGRGRTRGKKWEELKEILCDSDAYRKSFVTLIAARNSSRGGTKNYKRVSLSARKMWGAKTCVQFGGNEANIKKKMKIRWYEVAICKFTDMINGHEICIITENMLIKP
jgi:hypothetical protein